MKDASVGKVYSDGESIFRQGDAADCLYVIQSGNVVIHQETDGKEVELEKLGEGDTFGDMEVFMGLVRTESARSLGGVRVITADYRFVLKKFRDDPSYAFQVIEKMARRERVRKEKAEKAVGEKPLDAAFYDFAPVAAIDLDGDGIIRGINISGAAMLGTDRSGLIGLALESFVPPESVDVYRKHLAECGSSTEGVINELLLRTRKGVETRVQIFSYPKQDPGLMVYRTVVTELASRQVRRKAPSTGSGLPYERRRA